MPDHQLPDGARHLTAAELDEFGARLDSDEGMADFLTATFGHAGWTYDERADLWIVPYPGHQGPGRAFYLIRRGGDWRKAVLPDRVLS